MCVMNTVKILTQAMILEDLVIPSSRNVYQPLNHNTLQTMCRNMIALVPRAGGREGGREGGSGWREGGGEEGGREGEEGGREKREGGREGGREGEMEGGREGGRERTIFQQGLQNEA